MKTSKFLLCLVAVAAMMLVAMACSDKNDNEPTTPEDPTTPETPVNPDDWHSVPVSGGDISLDNFTLSLPSGTFEAETRIAITKEEKGHICGENEVTNFYQITSPITTNKPMTVKVASEELGDGYCLVIHTPSYLQSGGETSYGNAYMETTYANGAYSATVPTLANGEGDETASFSVGLVKVPHIGNTSTRAAEVLCENDVRGIKYKLYVDPALDSSDDVWNNFSPEIHASIGQYIEESINLLFDMGFSLKNLYGKRVVPFYYMRYYKKNEETKKNEIDREIDGGFRQDWLDDVYSYIGLNVDLIAQELSAESFNPTRLKCTIIHELFHYFQYDMDPRSAYTKAGGPRNKWLDNKGILFEMGSVWVEQFMNNGNLNPVFLKQKYDDGPKLGIGHEEERLPKSPQITDSQSEQGYLLGPWLYYLVKKIKTLNLNHEDKHPVLKLFELFSKNWKNTTHNTYYILQEWLDSYDKELYGYASWDDYYLQLWQGKLVKDFHASKLNLPQYADPRTYVLRNNDKTILYDDDSYSYGCCINRFTMLDYKNIDLSGKELVIKQNTLGLSSYLIWTSKESEYTKYDIYKRDQEPFATSARDSIVIRGKDLEALRPRDGYFSHEFSVITTNTYSPTSLISAYRIDKPQTSHVTVELRDTVEVKKQLKVSPTLLEFEAEGGTKSFTVKRGNFRCAGIFLKEGVDRVEEYSWLLPHKHWYGIETTEATTEIPITAYPNDDYYSKERTATYTAWAANDVYWNLDKAHDTFETTKVVVKQKGRGAPSTIINSISIKSNIKASTNDSWAELESAYRIKDGVHIETNEGNYIVEEKITTELEDGNLYVYASGFIYTKNNYTSTEGYFDEEWGKTFSFTISNFQSGPPVIKDLDVQYVRLRNDFTMDKKEMQATDIPLYRNSGDGNGLSWKAKRSDNNLNVLLLDFYGSGNVYQPSSDDFVEIGISFGE